MSAPPTKRLSALLYRSTIPLALLLLLLPVSCVRNPVTGRPQPVLQTSAREQSIGRGLAQQIEQQMGLVREPELHGYVLEIGARLAADSPRQNVEYHFEIVNMPEPNAFALPGGFIYVSRGLLVLANSEDELANVLGHEVGHVAAMHFAQRQTASAPFIPLRIVTGLSGAIVGIVSPTVGRGVASIGSAPNLLLAPHGRAQERQADEVGQKLAADGGWDPAAMSSFMNALTRYVQHRGGDPERTSFLSTHPSTPEREAETARRATTLTRADRPPVAPTYREFLEHLDGLLVGTSAREGTFDGSLFLHPELKFAVSFPDDWKTANTPQAVAAGSPDEKAALVLEIEAQGADPVAFARQYRAQDGSRLLGEPESLTISGLRAARGQIQTGGFGPRVRAELTWIACDDKIYLISGIARAEEFERFSGAFRATGDSFRRLEEADWPRIEEDRLRIVASKANETLPELVARTGTRWTPETVALVNNLQPDIRLAPGMLLKITKPERYVAK